VRAGGLWECRSVSVPDATQNGAPPPPPPPTGSPFGRFLTQPVFLVALLALIVAAPIAALALKGGDGSTAAAPAGPPVARHWAGKASAPNAVRALDVELTIRSLSGGEDGTLTRGRCSGTLRFRDKAGAGYAFAYEERADRLSCPRRATVVVEPLSTDRLRFVERRAGLVLAEGVLDEA
jgi:hypothetical protein